MSDFEILAGALALGFLAGRGWAWWRRRPRLPRPCKSCGSRSTFGGRLLHYNDCKAFPPGPISGSRSN